MQPVSALGFELPKPIHGHQPSTFLERGAAVPYTTPQLAGARVRPAERGGLELIVPNFSGGRGVYVLPLSGLRALCIPTLHDMALNERLAGLSGVTPSIIRTVAREVVAEGLAGKAAATTARTVLSDDRRQRLLAHFELLLELVRQGEQQGPGWVPPEASDHEQLGRRARNVLTALVSHVNRTTDEMLDMLEQLSALFAPIGVGRQMRTARLSIMVAMLDELRAQMRDWQRAGGSIGQNEAAIIEATAALTLQAARIMLTSARAPLANMRTLLQRWAFEPDSLNTLAAGPEWLLDGWERICQMWRAADDRIDRATTLAEMVALVPTTPRETNEWVGYSIDAGAELTRHRRKVLLYEDWRTGVTVTDLVARNERLLAFPSDGQT